MQIDFHHAVTYVLARMAGFDPQRAGIVAYSAQYVDDATNEGVVQFTNGAMYERISSAHKMLDYRNFDELQNHRAWMPFHFLPGNSGESAPAVPPQLSSGDFAQRSVCKANSAVARDMVKNSLDRSSSPHGLHRLGIAMHVYADTWAHREFCGMAHAINRASDLQDREGNADTNLLSRLSDFFHDKFDAAKGELVAEALPVGHGAVLSYPDKPFLVWKYTNGNGFAVERNNPAEFLDAAALMLDALKECRGRLPGPEATTGPAGKYLPEVGQCLKEFTDDDGGNRHQKWLDAIANGRFGFAEMIAYIPKGRGSWKYQAINDSADTDTDGCRYRYDPAFLGSNWKRFHDALQEHRLFVLNDLLPKYGLCAA
jgi:hypothetical protein